MIVVDGRTDKEKLFELLNAGGECDELDFKETLDLSNKLDALDFIKDAVSMCNRYPGGYIIVGADNDGRPSASSACVVRRTVFPCLFLSWGKRSMERVDKRSFFAKANSVVVTARRIAISSTRSGLRF